MFRTSIPRRWACGGALGVVLLLTIAGPGSAQRAQVGTRTGVRTGSNEWFLGAHLTAPLSSRLAFYPSVDVYSPAMGSLVAINGDLKVGLPTSSAVQFFTGTGLNVTRRRLGNLKTTDLAANLLGGIETRVGLVRPYLEGRIRLKGDRRFQVGGGLNIMLGRRR